jgi:hypothetical protein
VHVGCCAIAIGNQTCLLAVARQILRVEDEAQVDNTVAIRAISAPMFWNEKLVKEENALGPIRQAAMSGLRMADPWTTSGMKR